MSQINTNFVLSAKDNLYNINKRFYMTISQFNAATTAFKNVTKRQFALEFICMCENWSV